MKIKNAVKSLVMLTTLVNSPIFFSLEKNQFPYFFDFVLGENWRYSDGTCWKIVILNLREFSSKNLNISLNKHFIGEQNETNTC
jgi:hypothetical protein